MLPLDYLTPAVYPQTAASRLAGKIISLHEDRDVLSRLPSAALAGPQADFRGVAVIGLADDTGVRLNHGRPGAREGPAAFRQALARYGVDHVSWGRGTFPPVVDAGDIIPADKLGDTHDRVTEVALAVWDEALLPVGIGGGHDLTLPLVRAVAERLAEPLHGVYFDAHLDVRDTAGSGMAFRRLLQACEIGSLQCVGFDPLVNSRQHVDWFLSHGGCLASFDATAWPDERPQFASLDLDCVDAAYAPGVSAPNPAGLGAREIAAYAVAAGRCPAVCCFDIMELSPPHDVDGRTARLAAHLFLCFLLGCARRERSTVS